jgi:hypothetical protein
MTWYQNSLLHLPLCKAEVQHPYHAIGLDFDIARLQVAMDDSALVGR